MGLKSYNDNSTKALFRRRILAYKRALPPDTFDATSNIKDIKLKSVKCGKYAKFPKTYSLPESEDPELVPISANNDHAYSCHVKTDSPKPIRMRGTFSHDSDSDFDLEPNAPVIKVTRARPLKPEEIKKIEKFDRSYYETQIAKLRKRLHRMEVNNDYLSKQMDSLRKVFREDQVMMLTQAQSKVNWSDDTYKDAIAIRDVCGRVGYDLVRSKGFPLPSERGINRYIRRENIIGDLPDDQTVEVTEAEMHTDQDGIIHLIEASDLTKEIVVLDENDLAVQSIQITDQDTNQDLGQAKVEIVEMKIDQVQNESEEGKTNEHYEILKSHGLYAGQEEEEDCPKPFHAKKPLKHY